MNPKAWIVAAACLTAGMAQATCYSIYKVDGTLLQESSTAPVNMSLHIGDTVPEKFGPGATMTVSENDYYCRDRRGETPVGGRQSLAETVRADTEKAAAMVIKQPAGEPEVASK